MKYQVGKTGRVIVARFEDKEDILGNIIEIAKKENIVVDDHMPQHVIELLLREASWNIE